MSDTFDSIESRLATLRLNEPLNTFTWLPETISEEKNRISNLLFSGKGGKLAGSTFAVKDNIHVKGMPTTCSSDILKDYYPPYESTAVKRLREEDALILGKTNMDEFAMGSSSEYSVFGAVRNPLDTSRVAGGSSGGSAAAVAAGYVDFALGSDTGGSVRLPAAFCGVVGLKPTYGRISRYGLVAFASSLDQIGIFARDIFGCALVLGVIAGKDPQDATSSDYPVLDYQKNLNRTPEDLTVGVIEDFSGVNMEKRVVSAYRKFIKRIKNEGIRLKSISLFYQRHAVAAYHIIASAEASSNLLRYDGVRYGKKKREKGKSSPEVPEIFRTDGFGEEVKRRILMGTYVLSAGYHEEYYLRALKVRRLIRDEILNVLNEVDLILSPTSPVLPFSLNTRKGKCLEMYLTDYFTVAANLGGFPAISVPLETEEECLPTAVQIMGRYFDEETILRLGHFIERFN